MVVGQYELSLAFPPGRFVVAMLRGAVVAAGSVSYAILLGLRDRLLVGYCCCLALALGVPLVVALLSLSGGAVTVEHGTAGDDELATGRRVRLRALPTSATRMVVGHVAYVVLTLAALPVLFGLPAPWDQPWWPGR